MLGMVKLYHLHVLLSVVMGARPSEWDICASLHYIHRSETPTAHYAC